MGATYDAPKEGVAMEVRKDSWANWPTGETSVFVFGAYEADPS